MLRQIFLAKVQSFLRLYKNCNVYTVNIEKSNLADWCNEAADDIESWACYADSYFQEKHDLEGDLKVWRDRAKQFQ